VAPRVVVLDCLGTLVALEPPAPRLRRELAERGIDVSEPAAAAAFRAEIAYYLAHHLEGATLASAEHLRDRCAVVLAEALELGGETHGAVRAAMVAALRFSPFPDASPCLQALRAAGMACVAASNWDSTLPATLARIGLLPLLDAVITSAEVGRAKPDPEIFRAAAAAAGCAPTAAVCVGDSLEHDVAGARAAGMRAILLSRDGDAPEPPVEVPVARSLEEARSLVLALG
jgi:putative hydrolase of the HAD superfamily